MKKKKTQEETDNVDGILDVPVRAELALHVLVAQQPHRGGEVESVRAQDASEEGDGWEEGEGRGFEAGGGAGGGGVGEEAEGGFHGVGLGVDGEGRGGFWW